jgi:hypothetical protein
MVKPVAPALNALSRIAQIRPIAALGDAYEDGAPWLERLVKGQNYVGHILARLDDKTFNVAIDGHAAPMTLPAELEAGQTIRLKYLSDQPVPTFTLVAPAESDDSSAHLSKAAQLIDHYLQAAKHSATSAVFEATLAVSSNPADARQLAADLRHALVNSGLFYESHLAEFAHGARALADVLQEAQSRDNSVAGSLLVKQLGILENQRLLWHGEIWPGQTMHWQLQLEDEQERRDHPPASENAINEARPLSSSMTLQLPQLGKISARVDMAHGNMRIMLSAEDADTADMLAAARKELRTAIENNGQALDALTVQHG